MKIEDTPQRLQEEIDAKNSSTDGFVIVKKQKLRVKK